MATTVATMKMALASEEDLSAAYELLGLLDSIDRGYYPAGEEEEDAPMFLDEDDPEHLGRIYTRLKEILGLRGSGAMRRVIGGFSTLRYEKNQFLDPTKDTVELHPRIIKALELEAAMRDKSAPPTVAALPPFPVSLRKMWSGGDVQRWIDENIAPIVPSAAPAAPVAESAMRPETETENIARDIREGRFPKRSEPKMVPVAQAVAAPVAEPLIATPGERAVIDMLIALARATSRALDDSEERTDVDGRVHAIGGPDFDEMSDALDALDDLPDDKPGYTLDAGGKAEWALRNLGAAQAVAADGASTDEPVSPYVAWRMHANGMYGVLSELIGSGAVSRDCYSDLRDRIELAVASHENMAKQFSGPVARAAVSPAPAQDAPTSCPHADPFHYCATCAVSPCPIGLGGKK